MTRRATPAIRQVMTTTRPATPETHRGTTTMHSDGGSDDAPGNSGNAPGHDDEDDAGELRKRSGSRRTTDDGDGDDSPGNSGNAPGHNKDEDDETSGGPGTRATPRVTTRTTTLRATPEIRPATTTTRRVTPPTHPVTTKARSLVSATQQARAGGAASLGQRPPRLVFRVALFSALTLGIGAATLLVFIRHFERTRAEETATLQASVAAQAVVDRLRPSDLTAPLSDARREELDRILTARVLDDGTPASAIATADGRLVHATDGAGAAVRSPVARAARPGSRRERSPASSSRRM